MIRPFPALSGIYMDLKKKKRKKEKEKQMPVNTWRSKFWKKTNFSPSIIKPHSPNYLKRIQKKGSDKTQTTSLLTFDDFENSVELF